MKGQFHNRHTLRNLLSVFVLLLFSFFIHAQQHDPVDSLKRLLKTANSDTLRCSILSQLAEVAVEQEWPKFNEEVLQIAETNLKKGNLNEQTNYSFKKYYASAVNNVGFQYQNKGDMKKALENYSLSLSVCEEIGFKVGIARAFNQIGVIYFERGDIHEAMRFFERSLKMKEEMKDVSGMAYTLTNLATMNLNTGNIPKALEQFSKSLKLFENLRMPDGSIGNKERIANGLRNMGSVYIRQGDPQKALEYFKKGLELCEEAKDILGMAEALNDLGFAYQATAEFTKAMECYEKSLTYYSKAENKTGTAIALCNIGSLYFKKISKEYIRSDPAEAKQTLLKAIEYFERSLKLDTETGNKKGMAYTYNNIGKSLITLQKLGSNNSENERKGKELLKQSLAIFMEQGSPEGIELATNGLFDLYKNTGDYKKALETLELNVKMRDSINNESTRKASIKTQLKYEYEKQAAADSVAHEKESQIKTAELRRQSAEIKTKKNQQYALYGGLALVILFAGFMYNRFKITQKQKLVIEEQKAVVEEQKKIVEEKQKEILDSIHYAKRIQLALIPSEKRIEQVLDRLLHAKNK